MKRMLFTLLAALQLFGGAAAPETLRDDAIDIKAPSAVLMEKQSGEVIYEKIAHERMAPASVTKVMTMLLIVEAIENGDISLDDTVIASERAASFGGSCVFLEEGEKMSVHEMLKCISVVSANDCAVAMAEHLCGSEQSFIHWIKEIACTVNAGTIAKSLCKTKSKNNACIFYQMMLINIQIPLNFSRKIKKSVLTERTEHVVKKSNWIF